MSCYFRVSVKEFNLYAEVKPISFLMVTFLRLQVCFYVNIPLAATNLNLAQTHYSLRFEELRKMIVAEETKFKSGVFFSYIIYYVAYIPSSF